MRAVFPCSSLISQMHLFFKIEEEEKMGKGRRREEGREGEEEGGKEEGNWERGREEEGR